MGVAYYVDTSVLASALIPSDVKYKASSEALRKIRERDGRLLISTYTLAELVSVVCRKTLSHEWKYAEPFEQIIKMSKESKELCRYLVSGIISFLEEKFGVLIVEEPCLYAIEKLNYLNIAKMFKKAVELSWIKIRFKDLIHLVIALLLSRKYGVSYIVTADKKDFSNIEDSIKKTLGLKIMIID
jgi:predicted nucleic acid-binding protein